jgi:TM2 domain-containing membrane protein YozV
MGNQFTARMGAERSDTRTVSGAELRQMHFEANKKSMGVAYLLWFFFGGFGGHRFYAGRTQSAVIMLASVIATHVLALTISSAFYMVGLIIGIWMLADAFLIPGMIREHNNELIGPYA